MVDSCLFPNINAPELTEAYREAYLQAQEEVTYTYDELFGSLE